MLVCIDMAKQNLVNLPFYPLRPSGQSNRASPLYYSALVSETEITNSINLKGFTKLMFHCLFTFSLLYRKGRTECNLMKKGKSGIA